MVYHAELLKSALDVVIYNQAPNQADLRRCVSTAYYALFHLLVSETVANWSLDSSRDALARMFDHSPMKKASEKISNSKLFPFAGVDPVVVEKLRTVGASFGQLQEKRHIADYDNATHWTATEAFEQVIAAANAFRDWAAIRHEKIAQDYLVSLLIRKRD